MRVDGDADLAGLAGVALGAVVAQILMTYIGTGLPMEPGRGVEFVRLPTVSGVSVWPKPS